jgi:hypothetical protein
MRTSVIISASLALILVLAAAGAAEAASKHVPVGVTYNVTGTEHYDNILVEGTMVIQNGGHLTTGPQQDDQDRSNISGPGATLIVEEGGTIEPLLSRKAVLSNSIKESMRASVMAPMPISL